jgi:hypothetical protein
MTASVPEETNRARSQEGTRRRISSASKTSFLFGAPNENEFFVVDCTASKTAGWAWPKIIGPQELTKSMYLFPSMSRICEPDPETKYLGVPPTA